MGSNTSTQTLKNTASDFESTATTSERSAAEIKLEESRRAIEEIILRKEASLMPDTNQQVKKKVEQEQEPCHLQIEERLESAKLVGDYLTKLLDKKMTATEFAYMALVGSSALRGDGPDLKTLELLRQHHETMESKRLCNSVIIEEVFDKIQREGSSTDEKYLALTNPD